MKEKLLIVELNEFNVELLNQGVEELGLKNIQKILNLNHSKTLSDAKTERHGLDPWVQWVTVHTGQNSSQHKVIRIGEVPNLKFPQIWEKLGENGITTGIWGAMNASRNNTKGCKFFLPDPWTFSEAGYPKLLNFYLNLPRIYSKNYVKPSKIKLANGFLKMLIFLLSSRIFLKMIREPLYYLSSLFKVRIQNITLFSLFDLFNTVAFLKYKKETNPDFSIIFLNSLAHLQHHHWNKKINNEMKMCLENLDKIFEKLFNEIKKNESIVVINALSQRNIFKKGIHIYRQINTLRFLATIKVNFKKVEEGMTNDCHVFFNTVEDLESAYIKLTNIQLNNEKIFFVEKDSKQKFKIFFQLSYYKKINSDDYFQLFGQEYKFFDYFTLIRERTGEHFGEGDIYSEKLYFPKVLNNYEIYKYILKNFNISMENN